jgi:hypothetical protein
MISKWEEKKAKKTHRTCFTVLRAALEGIVAVTGQQHSKKTQCKDLLAGGNGGGSGGGGGGLNGREVCRQGAGNTETWRGV